MEKNNDFTNPFEAFGGFNFSEDGGNSGPLMLEENVVDEAGKLSVDVDAEKSIDTIDQSRREILSVRPSERIEVVDLSTQEVIDELDAYLIPSSATGLISPKIQSELLSEMRRVDEIKDYNTLGAKRRNGEKISELAVRLDRKLKHYAIEADNFTEDELIKIDTFASNSTIEVVSDKIDTVRDILSKHLNGVNSRRDYMGLDEYNSDYKSTRILEIFDKINDFEANEFIDYTDIERPLTGFELDKLRDRYGNEYIFNNIGVTVDEVASMGYELECLEGDYSFGPLTYSDVNFVFELAKNSYARDLNRLDVITRDLFPVNMYENMDQVLLEKFISNEISVERRISLRPLVSGFSALGLDVINSGIINESKKHNTDQSIINLRKDLLNNLSVGAIECAKICDIDKDQIIKYAEAHNIKSRAAILEMCLDEVENMTDRTVEHRDKNLSERLTKIDRRFSDMAALYDSLKLVMDMRQQTKKREEPTTEVIEDKKPALSRDAIRRLLGVTSSEN